MKTATETREVITVEAGRGSLRGTYHKPRGASVDPDGRNRIGVLYLCWLVPRAANGDSAVYWADAMAKSGYFTFRFDLPGLGDSDGDLATPGIEIDAGAYGPALSAMVSSLVERFHLSAMVVVGNCAGAVTAVYAAAANDRVRGLVLLDPYFHVQQNGEDQTVLLQWHVRILNKLLGSRVAQSGLRDAAVKVLSFARNVYRGVTSNHLLVRRKQMPGNANLTLIRSWSKLAAARLPMLVLRSPSAMPKAGEFDYIGFLETPPDSGSRLTSKFIERATHAFAESYGREAVRTHSEEWFSTYFPLTDRAGIPDTGNHSTEIASGVLGIAANVHSV